MPFIESSPAVAADPSAAPTSTAIMLSSAGLSAKRRGFSRGGAGPAIASSGRGRVSSSTVLRAAREAGSIAREGMEISLGFTGSATGSPVGSRGPFGSALSPGTIEGDS